MSRKPLLDLYHRLIRLGRYVRKKAPERAGIAGLMEGQRVAVDVIDGRKGPEAAGLRLI